MAAGRVVRSLQGFAEVLKISWMKGALWLALLSIIVSSVRLSYAQSASEGSSMMDMIFENEDENETTANGTMIYPPCPTNVSCEDLPGHCIDCMFDRNCTYGSNTSVLCVPKPELNSSCEIHLGSKLMASRSVLVFYLVSYGIPLIVTAWYIPTGKLGYDTVSGSGWCSLLVSRSYGEHSRFMPLNSIFGSDMWVYLTMFIVPVIFISLYCHLKSEVKKQAILSQNWKSTVQSVEFKFLFIPVFFILLRIWSLLFMAIVGQGKVDLPCFAVQFFIYTAGIGDSGQGFANSILYVLFTRRVRNYFLLCFLCRCGSTRKRDREGAILVGTERQTFNSSFSSDLERKDFSDDFSNSGNLTDRERERKSLLLNS